MLDTIRDALFVADGRFESASTTFGMSLLAILSQDNVLFLLGALLAAVRLCHEIVRLWRYILNPDQKEDDDE